LSLTVMSLHWAPATLQRESKSRSRSRHRSLVSEGLPLRVLLEESCSIPALELLEAVACWYSLHVLSLTWKLHGLTDNHCAGSMLTFSVLFQFF
jgi:hypothetical protein